ncbi:MAG: NAD+ synthase [Anaerolineae bacterium]|nr:NAD+ synthase [Anaerolineae bacterium]
MINLKINTDLTRKILIGFIKSEITRVGFSRAVINISGGIDSALSCVLAAEALGPENVLALKLPYSTSSPESLEHAQMVIYQFNIKSETVDITDMVDPVLHQDLKMSKVRKGNVMARSRMIILYDRSEAFGALAVGTSNKTEILLGYSTLWGDSAAAINPIGDLYKTQVRQLARAMGIPNEIIDKPPSADLWSGQTDEDELGFTYEQADKLLYLLVDQRYSPEECLEAGFDKNFIHKVITRIRKTQFKRMLPPIAKLSNRTVGYDFLYLRDWGS